MVAVILYGGLGFVQKLIRKAVIIDGRRGADNCPADQTKSKEMCGWAIARGSNQTCLIRRFTGLRLIRATSLIGSPSWESKLG